MFETRTRPRWQRLRGAQIQICSMAQSLTFRYLGGDGVRKLITYLHIRSSRLYCERGILVQSLWFTNSFLFKFRCTNILALNFQIVQWRSEAVLVIICTVWCDVTRHDGREKVFTQIVQPLPHFKIGLVYVLSRNRKTVSTLMKIVAVRRVILC